jgi:hypothetical protein
MEHFSKQTWADFVRGISESATRANIESHLARGCVGCTTNFDIWNRVTTISATERTYTPPDSAVRMMELEFAARYAMERRPSVLASLLFDTLSQPLPAGMRSGVAVVRQLVYEAEGFTVDLRLDPQSQSGKICVVGQVLGKGVPRISPSSASIMLWTEKGQPIVHVSANEYGEFQLEFDAQENLRLSIDAAGRKTIRIPLTNLGPGNVAE